MSYFEIETNPQLEFDPWGCSSMPFDQPYQRVDWTSQSGIVSLKDEDANKMHCLYKHRFTTGFDGTENRRLNIEKTDIVLAFPVKKESGTYVPLIWKRNLPSHICPLGILGSR
jgi:hypothetical protein